MTTNESSPSFPDQPVFANHPSAPAEPGKPWWTLWIDALVALGAWGVSLAFIAFIPLFMVIPYIIHISAKSGPPDAATLASDKAILFLSILGVIPAHLATFALIWLIVTYAGRVSFVKAIGLEWPPAMGPLWGSLLSIVIALALLGVGGVVTHFFGDQKTDLDLLVESSIQARWATAFVAFFTAPLVEEALYRGLLYSSFEKALARFIGRGAAMAPAIIAVSILFAGVHVYQYRNNLAVISVITLLSISLTLVRALSGKLMPCFIIHLVFNGIQSVLLIVTSKSDITNPPPVPSFSLFSDLIRYLS